MSLFLIVSTYEQFLSNQLMRINENSPRKWPNSHSQKLSCPPSLWKLSSVFDLLQIQVHLIQLSM